MQTLKTWPEHFRDIVTGKKTFELRRADRDFKLGEVLELVEFDPKTETLTGEMTRRRVTHILRGPSDFGLADGFVILSLESPSPAFPSCEPEVAQLEAERARIVGKIVRVVHGEWKGAPWRCVNVGWRRGMFLDDRYIAAEGLGCECRARDVIVVDEKDLSGWERDFVRAREVDRG